MKSFIIRPYIFLAIILLAGAAACSKAPVTPTSTPESAVATKPTAALPAPTPSPTPAATLSPGDTPRTLTVDGMERTYRLYVPAGLAADRPIPLVFVFHGFQQSAVAIHAQSGMNDIADANGFLVAYPNGSGPANSRSWNASGCCGYAYENNVDDEAFIRAMLTDVGSIAKVDPKRIYASGFSNGGMLSFRLACDMSDVFAAIAPVGGVLLTDPCQPQEPVSVIQVHGLEDTVIPYGGEQDPTAEAPSPPVEKSLGILVALDGCSGEPQVTHNGIVTHTVYPNCQPGIAVELYALKWVGHEWPVPSLTKPSMSQTIWDFFAAHPKP